MQSVSYKSKCIIVFLTIFNSFNLFKISFLVNTPPKGKCLYSFFFWPVMIFLILVDFPIPALSEVKIEILSNLSNFIFSKSFSIDELKVFLYLIESKLLYISELFSLLNIIKQDLKVPLTSHKS